MSLLDRHPFYLRDSKGQRAGYPDLAAARAALDRVIAGEQIRYQPQKQPDGSWISIRGPDVHVTFWLETAEGHPVRL
jgi:hypothetical protein